MSSAGISIIFPTYNRPAYIAESIQSVADQSYKNWELLITDSSTDPEALKIIRSFLSDQRVKYEFQPARGISAAKNASLRRAGFDFIAHLESDDVWLPHALETLLAEMEKYPDADVVGGDVIHIDAGGRETKTRIVPEIEEDLLGQMLRLGNFIPPSGCLIRKRVFEKIGMFDENTWGQEIMDLWLRAAAAGIKFRHVNKVMFKGRYHPDTMSASELVFPDRIKFSSTVNKRFPGYRRLWRIQHANIWDEYGLYHTTKGRRVRAVLSHIRAILWNPFNIRAYWHIVKVICPFAARLVKR